MHSISFTDVLCSCWTATNSSICLSFFPTHISTVRFSVARSPCNELIRWLSLPACLSSHIIISIIRKTRFYSSNTPATLTNLRLPFFTRFHFHMCQQPPTHFWREYFLVDAGLVILLSFILRLPGGMHTCLQMSTSRHCANMNKPLFAYHLTFLFLHFAVILCLLSAFLNNSLSSS